MSALGLWRCIFRSKSFINMPPTFSLSRSGPQRQPRDNSPLIQLKSAGGPAVQWLLPVLGRHGFRTTKDSIWSSFYWGNTEKVRANKWVKGRRGQWGASFKYSFLVCENKRQKEVSNSLSMGTQQNGTSYAQDGVLSFMDCRLLFKTPCFTWVSKSFFFSNSYSKKPHKFFFSLLETVHTVYYPFEFWLYIKLIRHKWQRNVF